MTPAEHYLEAERLLGEIGTNRTAVTAAGRAHIISLAQVHATLATVSVRP